ncbi:MAG: AAA family ATPase [Oscillospiraceae bacterium]|jgi:cobyrinic acid ac-diamide synthase
MLAGIFLTGIYCVVKSVGLSASFSRAAHSYYYIRNAENGAIMSKIIAVTSGKGGTGKSSICSELGFALAKQGHRTLIIELDFGLRCLDIMLGVKNDIKYDLGNVLKGECDIYQATTQVKIATNLSIVCAPEDPFARVDAETIKNICQEMRKYYEYIIVDTSAGTNASVFDVVEQSDLILINTTPDPVCVRDARTMSDEFYKRGNKKQRLIINKVNPDLFKADLVVDLDEIIDTVGVQLIGVIPDDDAVIIATSKGEPLPSSSLAFKAFDAISKRIKGEDVPLSFKVLLQ